MPGAGDGTYFLLCRVKGRQGCIAQGISGKGWAIPANAEKLIMPFTAF
jgi:hypothetical protein